MDSSIPGGSDIADRVSAVLAPLADRVLVPVVVGNHDESRRDRIVPMTDSWAIEAASAVADALVGVHVY
jgi:hypothetical protein